MDVAERGQEVLAAHSGEQRFEADLEASKESFPAELLFSLLVGHIGSIENTWNLLPREEAEGKGRVQVGGALEVQHGEPEAIMAVAGEIEAVAEASESQVVDVLPIESWLRLSDSMIVRLRVSSTH